MVEVRRRFIFLLSFSTSLDLFDDSKKRLVNGERCVTSSLIGNFWLISCLNFLLVVTAFSACYITKRAIGTINVCNVMEIVCETFYEVMRLVKPVHLTV